MWVPPGSDRNHPDGEQEIISLAEDEVGNMRESEITEDEVGSVRESEITEDEVGSVREFIGELEGAEGTKII